MSETCKASSQTRTGCRFGRERLRLSAEKILNNVQIVDTSLFLCDINSQVNKMKVINSAAEWGYSLPIEYYDSIQGRLSDFYSVISQV